jgi:hypothetical protein
MVGAEGFELSTPCSQSKCSTRLSYAPNECGLSLPERIWQWVILRCVKKVQIATWLTRSRCSHQSWQPTFMHVTQIAERQFGLAF